MTHHCSSQSWTNEEVGEVVVSLSVDMTTDEVAFSEGGRFVVGHGASPLAMDDGAKLGMVVRRLRTRA